MKIVSIEVSKVALELKKPFVTAVRRVTHVNDIYVKVTTDTGLIGYGEAAPTTAITGDSEGSIIYAIENVIAPAIIGMSLESYELILQKIQKCMKKNSSAKAAVDIAVYDLIAKKHGVPLYKFLGGAKSKIETDLTISLNSVEQMVADSLEAVALGYKTLKIKVGNEYKKDIERIVAIQQAIGMDILLRIDANQGWSLKEGTFILEELKKYPLNIELIEQPLVAEDITGMAKLCERTIYPILADEAIFTPLDVIEVIQKGAADLINIKLMKCGGIYPALQICAIAESYGVECFMGCMLESHVSVTAAAHLAAAKSIITKYDLDGPGLLKSQPLAGGATFNEQEIILNETPGLGF